MTVSFRVIDSSCIKNGNDSAQKQTATYADKQLFLQLYSEANASNLTQQAYNASPFVTGKSINLGAPQVTQQPGKK